jgi:CRISPR-associated endonuclease/helicase Cas3
LSSNQSSFVAHTRQQDGATLEFHLLEDHLTSVSVLAGEFANEFASSEWAQWAGLWHDLGKYRPGFQRYIRQNSDGHIEGRVPDRSKTHSAAGALWAYRWLFDRNGPAGALTARVLQYLIAGHHAGLDNWDGRLAVRLAGVDANTELDETIGAAPPQEILNPPLPVPRLDDLRIDRRDDIPGRFALWVRMLFSCLVDGDFLDTEAFMSSERANARGRTTQISELHAMLDAHITEKMEQVRSAGLAETPINLLRADVLRQCRAKAELPPRAFTLTVPTGGGKTLSGLTFALAHALRHGKRRIIYAIPYTSIIEQTAEIFRGILGDDNVVEHHSNSESEPESETSRSRLACENWDAPVIVTTNVQFFESLFARRTSRCRKLHNIANSVVVLDEAQLLPTEFLQPIVDVLRLLVSEYGVTLVLCTATQPTLTEQRYFDVRRNFRGFRAGEVTEIIDDVASLYRAVNRVRVHLPATLTTPEPWPAIVEAIARHESVLAIVNRRADAREVYELLKRNLATRDTGLWHLSALMCAEHRSDVLADIKSALVRRREAIAQGAYADPVRVVSTQLVEAGVDVDFPVVFRAMAGLDSIAQAAGRCNREGLLPSGEVFVFVPTSEPPPGLLRQARDTCKTVWHDRPDDPLRLELFGRYFAKLYANAHLDACDIVSALRPQRDSEQRSIGVRFRDASDNFRLIDDRHSATVLVRYRGSRAVGKSKVDVDGLIGMLERDGPARWLMRKLQRFGVTLYRHDIERLLRLGEIREVSGVPGLYVQVSEASDLFYDPVLGANASGAPGDPSNYVA